MDNGERQGRFWSWLALVVGVGIWITGGITFGGSFVLAPAGVVLTLVAMRWSRRDTVFWIPLCDLGVMKSPRARLGPELGTRPRRL